MRLNITCEYMPLDDFKALFDNSTNIKDVHFICHQAGCPVYIIRNKENKCSIIWHPYKDKSKNILNPILENGVLKVVYENKEQPFQTTENLRRDIIIRYILGDNPFNSECMIWSINIK